MMTHKLRLMGWTLLAFIVGILALMAVDMVMTYGPLLFLLGSRINFVEDTLHFVATGAVGFVSSLRLSCWGLFATLIACAVYWMLLSNYLETVHNGALNHAGVLWAVGASIGSMLAMWTLRNRSLKYSEPNSGARL